MLVIGYPKCSTVQKAKKWLDENGGATETPQSNLDTIAAAKEAN